MHVLKREQNPLIDDNTVSGSGFSCNLYSSVIQTQDNLLGFVSKTAM